MTPARSQLSRFLVASRCVTRSAYHRRTRRYNDGFRRCSTTAALRALHKIVHYHDPNEEIEM